MASLVVKREVGGEAAKQARIAEFAANSVIPFTVWADGAPFLDRQSPGSLLFRCGLRWNYDHVHPQKTVGPGGFIDIAQNARKVVFCGTLAAKGVKLATGDGHMRVQQQGVIQKVVAQVEQITFSGPQALQRGQQVLFLTERASFRLTAQGVELFEIAPGIDLQRDVLAQIGFKPLITPELALMHAGHFLASGA